MLSKLFYLSCFRGPVSHRSMSIGGKGKKDKNYEFIYFKIHHKIKCDGSLNIQLTLIPLKAFKLYYIHRREKDGEANQELGESGQHREEPRGGHRSFAE